jgi:hypothetical protein
LRLPLLLRAFAPLRETFLASEVAHHAHPTSTPILSACSALIDPRSVVVARRVVAGDPEFQELSNDRRMANDRMSVGVWSKISNKNAGFSLNK